MKYLKEGVIIFAITLAGEFLNQLLPFPVPAGVYGLFLMLMLLCTGMLKLESVETVGNFLLEIMPVLFIPVSVGLMESYGDMREILLPLLIICTVSTVTVMAATGKVAELMIGSGRVRTGEQREQKRKVTLKDEKEGDQ